MASAMSHTSPVLPNTALFIAAVPGLVGAIGLVRPSFILQIFEFRRPTAAQDAKLMEGFSQLFSVRDLYLAASTLAIWYTGDRKLLGMTTLLGTGVVIVDGIVQKQQTGSGEWKHWGLVPVTATVGAALLGWLDGLLG